MALALVPEPADDPPVPTDASAPSPEDALLDRVRTGDAGAIAELFRTLQPGLLRYARGLVGSDAEDVAQEAWLALAQALPTLRGGYDGARALLFSSARRRAIDRLRRRSRRPEDEPLPDDAEPSAGDGADPDHVVTSRLGTKEAVDFLRRTCTQEQTEVVLLRVVAGFGTEEVADLLGRSTTWVRVTQHRALAKLADRLGARAEPVPDVLPERG